MAKMSFGPRKPDDFVKAANQVHGDHPWDAPSVRDDIMKQVPLRVPESYAIKLQWLSDQTGIPQQRLLRDVILPWLDGEVEKHTK